MLLRALRGSSLFFEDDKASLDNSGITENRRDIKQLERDLLEINMEDQLSSRACNYPLLILVTAFSMDLFLV